MTMTRSFFTTLALTIASPALAADDAQLFALRDVLLPGVCTADGATATHPMDGGVLHALPCRSTPRDVLTVFVWESDDGLRPALFPVAQITDPGADARNWSAQEITNFASTALASSPEVEGDRITLSHRVAPGVGNGYLVHRYRMQDGQPVLSRVSYSFARGYETPLWPARDRHDRLPPVPFDIDGHADVTRDLGPFENPLDIVAELGITFPTDPDEEGRTRMTIQMTQNSDALAMQIEERGWADDSVSGQAFRVLMRLLDKGWQVTRIGKVQICARGEVRRTPGRCP